MKNAISDFNNLTKRHKKKGYRCIPTLLTLNLIL